MAKKGEKFKIPDAEEITPLEVIPPIKPKPTLIPTEPEILNPDLKTAPRRPRFCQEFLDHWNPRIRGMFDCVELDYSYFHRGISVTDMRIPSALRHAKLYSEAEVNDRVDLEEGDLERRVDAFLRKGPRGA